MNERLRRCIVRTGATVTDAMRSLEGSMAQIVLVVDHEDRLVGALTDGDIRRALLAGATMSSAVAPYASRRVFTAPASAGRAEILELMQARQISQVPVVDDEMRLVGLHLLHEMLAVVERPNRAVVMAGGRGTRLAPLTNEVPKPMLRVAGRPILERIVLHLVGSGIRHIYLAVNYMADLIEEHFEKGGRFGCRIEYLRETTPLGTGGALSLLPEVQSHAFLVMNGDLVTQFNVGRILDYHETGTQEVTMAVRHYYHTVPYGCVEVQGDELVAFAEKPTTTHLINAGIYVLHPNVLECLAPGETVSLPEIMTRVLGRGGRIRVFEMDDDWIDVGRRGELERARGHR